MKHPTTKQQAKAYQEEGIPWGASKDIGQGIVNYLIDLGAKHEMPDDKKGTVDYVNDFHKAMVIKNEYMPDDIPFSIIYGSFFSAVLNNFVELPEFQPWTVKNQLKGFKGWITKGGQLERLYERFYSEYPEKRPKLIANSGTKLETWSDEVIRDQQRQIQMMFGGEIPVPEVAGIQNYFQRIEAEYQRRGL